MPDISNAANVESSFRSAAPQGQTKIAPGSAPARYPHFSMSKWDLHPARDGGMIAGGRGA
jgi:hypothetical protein